MASKKDEITKINGKYTVKLRNSHMLSNYKPPIVDYNYLCNILTEETLKLISNDTLDSLTKSSLKLQNHFKVNGPPLLRRAGEMFPWRETNLSLEEQNQKFALHSNTEECIKKALVYKLEPVQPYEGCDKNCAYCLVGRQHAQDENGNTRYDTIWTVSETLIKRDYDIYVANELEKMYRNNKQLAIDGKAVVLDLGPSTDYFSAAMIESGMAHKILLAIIGHISKYPDDPIQIIVYTKAGLGEMVVPGPRGEPPIFTLLQSTELSSQRIIVVGSIAPMSMKMREVLEPGAPVLEDRLNLYEVLCRNDLLHTVLYQPLIPGVYNDELVITDLKMLANIGVQQVKLQMIASDEATAATIGPLINEFLGKDAGRKFWGSIDWGIPQSNRKSGRRYPVKAELTFNDLIKYKKIAGSLGLHVSFCRYDIRYCSHLREQIELLCKEGKEAGISNDAVENNTGKTCIGYRLKPFCIRSG
jgi:DNA repair photolyase